MSAKRTAMRKLREVLRLSYSARLSIRKISASTKISVGSIQNILKLAAQLNITWPLPEDWDDQTLALKFYPRSDAQPSGQIPRAGLDGRSYGTEEERPDQAVALGRVHPAVSEPLL